MPATATEPRASTVSATKTAGRRRGTIPGEVLIASHGGASGAAAVRVGRLIADRWQAPAEVVGVLPPVALYPPEAVVDMGMLEDVECAALQAQLTAQVAILSRCDPDTPVSVVTGGPADLIVEIAREHHASLVVLGLGRREPLDRLLGGQTPIRVLRRAALPVLAVGHNAVALPRVVVIATDFSESATAAARLALTVTADNAVIHLIHVEPDATHLARAGGDSAMWRRVVEEGTTGLVEHFRKALVLPSNAELHQTILRGDAAPAIARFAADADAELIAVGSHGRKFSERLLLGSVAETLLRTAQSSVLVVSARTAG